MAKLTIDLTESRPRFVSTGTAPTGGYKFRIDAAELRDNENNDGKNVLLTVELVEGSNPDGVGQQQQMTIFPASAEKPTKPGDNASDADKKAFRMAVDNNNKFLGFLVSIGLPEEKLRAKKVAIETDNWIGKEGYVYIEPAPDRDSRPRFDMMSPKQYADIVAGKLKINPRQPKEGGEGGGSRGGSRAAGKGGGAADIADDLDNIDAGAGTKAADTTKNGKSAGAAKAKAAGGDDLDDVPM